MDPEDEFARRIEQASNELRDIAAMLSRLAMTYGQIARDAHTARTHPGQESSAPPYTRDPHYP